MSIFSGSYRLHFKCCVLENWTFIMAPIDGKYMTFSLMTMIIFALYLTIYDTFSNQIKCQKFDLENEGKGQRWDNLDLRRSTGNVRIYIGVFPEFLLPAKHTFTQKVTHTYNAYTYLHGEWWWCWLQTKYAKQICLQMLMCPLLAMSSKDRYRLHRLVAETMSRS